ncbi:nucleotidyl transferase AbiEii/AbiGii toxin family protein [Rhodococcus opacus]|uniref:nucleotidyl transferase AbiEii/AbiGii toxin family protein n=1 Tax=Rhodococcus opacus TaxID=37919 RepID=UPI002475AEAC|nr:nucleotidyl transferase AbiEii/AbiGii toxin family protein [Rhodococcus opacus]MDH6286237.1 hypothetical protein [Rhodococcus opacus]
MNLDERDRVTDLFGVAPEQVERDHLISLLLAYLSDHFADRLHFIGDTALARTHLPHGRLSEDIDLIALDPRRSTLAADLDAALPSALQRAYGRLEWAPPLSAGSSVDAATLHTTSGLLAATALGGQIMRMPDDLGQVKAGFYADMILIDGDPLEDINILQDQSKIVGIMKNGVFHKDPGSGQSARPAELSETHRGTPIPA